LQITDILKDVKEDANMERLYVPIEFVKSAKILSSDPEHVVTDKNFTVVRQKLGIMAEENLKSALSIINRMNPQDSVPFKILTEIYSSVRTN
jgi:phytoene synthase